MKKYAILFLVCLALLLVASTASGQTGGGYDLTWNTLPSGGQTFASGGSYTLGGAAADVSSSTPLTGGTFSLTGGFWAEPHPLNVTSRSYMPVIKN